MVAELKTDVKELKDTIRQLEKTLIEVTANQNFFREKITEHYEQQSRLYEKMINKFNAVDKEVQRMDKKISYAAGIIITVTTVMGMISSKVLAKIGL